MPKPTLQITDFHGTVLVSDYHMTLSGDMFNQFTGTVSILDGKAVTGMPDFKDEHNASWVACVDGPTQRFYFPGCKVKSLIVHEVEPKDRHIPANRFIVP